jgi:hypothetical protein
MENDKKNTLEQEEQDSQLMNRIGIAFVGKSDQRKIVLKSIALLKCIEKEEGQNTLLE